MLNDPIDRKTTKKQTKQPKTEWTVWFLLAQDGLWSFVYEGDTWIFHRQCMEPHCSSGI